MTVANPPTDEMEEYLRDQVSPHAPRSMWQLGRALALARLTWRAGWRRGWCAARGRPYPDGLQGENTEAVADLVVLEIEALVEEGYEVQVHAYGTGLRRRRVVACRDGARSQGSGRDLLEALQVCGRQVSRAEARAQKGAGA